MKGRKNPLDIGEKQEKFGNSLSMCIDLILPKEDQKRVYIIVKRNLG